jgi:hypothetical protein
MIFGMFKTMRRSMAKSKALRAASQKLAAASQPTIDPHMLMQQRDLSEEGLGELLTIVHNDPDLSRIVAHYGATQDDLRQVYRALLVTGAGQMMRGHWVPASALAFGTTLDFVLRNSKEGLDRDGWIDVTYTVLQYFERGQMGKV